MCVVTALMYRCEHVCVSVVEMCVSVNVYMCEHLCNICEYVCV